MFTVSPEYVEFIGAHIGRGERVLATKSGDVLLLDCRGGVNIVRARRTTEGTLAHGAPEGFVPNGIALLPDRSFLMADLGSGGGMWHMAPDGALTPRLPELGGRKLEPTNFVGIDRQSHT